MMMMMRYLRDDRDNESLHDVSADDRMWPHDYYDDDDDDALPAWRQRWRESA